MAPIQIVVYEGALHKKSIGVVCGTDKLDGSAFNELDRYLVFLLANQIGIALRNAELYEKATVDSLTQVSSRAFFLQRMHKIIARKSSPDISVLMVDLDHFKKVNDTFTHQAGDYLLVILGKLLREAVQAGEIVGRYGGEEFILLIQANYVKALERATEVKEKVATHTFLYKEQQINVTISIGVATLNSSDTMKLLIERADRALYLAKDWGRNQVVGEGELDKYQQIESQSEKLA